MINRLEGYTGDGFQERKAYIGLQHDLNNLSNKSKQLNTDLLNSTDKKNVVLIQSLKNNNYNSQSMNQKNVKEIFKNNNIIK